MRLGTSSLVVAAFVGPGTVLTCAAAGVEFGYDLAWVLLFATATVFILQSLTAGTGILAGHGLGEAIREAVQTRAQKLVAYGLVVVGLWVGCAAFEMGNLMGAASGIAALTEADINLRWYVLLISFIAGTILLLDLKVLVRVFTGLVVLMSVLFLGALIVAPVDWSAALRGLAVPSLPSGSLLTVVALLGTTVVTYNLFLHASASKEYWQGDVNRKEAWWRELGGMAIFLPVGGLISFAILASGGTMEATTASPDDIATFAQMLEPVAGPAARILFGLGLFAAGITSAMTAPMAAAAGIHELFEFEGGTQSWSYRAIWGSVLGVGCAFALVGWSPLPAIIAAQAANGLLLPVVAGFMLYLTIRQPTTDLPRWYIALGGLVTLICAGLGARTLLWVFGVI